MYKTSINRAPALSEFSLFPPLNSQMPSQIKLTTSDNEEFCVDRDVAERSVLIKNMLEGNCYIHANPRLLSPLLGFALTFRCWRERTPHPASQCLGNRPCEGAAHTYHTGLWRLSLR